MLALMVLPRGGDIFPDGFSVQRWIYKGTRYTVVSVKSGNLMNRILAEPAKGQPDPSGIRRRLKDGWNTYIKTPDFGITLTS